MGTPNKSYKHPGKAPSATELCAGGVESEPRRLGRRLILRFISRPKPQLKTVEFHFGSGRREFAYLMQRDNKGRSFTWTEVPRALSLLFVEYLCAGLEGRGEGFTFPGSRYGSLAASFGYAIAKNSGPIYRLFAEITDTRGEVPCIEQVFDWDNLEGKEDNERLIMVRSDFLAPDCVDVYWESEPLIESAKLRALSDLIRTAWKLEPSRQPPPPGPPQLPRRPDSAGESPKATQQPKQEELLPAEPKPPSESTPKVQPPPAPGDTIAGKFIKIIESGRLREEALAQPPSQTEPTPTKKPEPLPPVSQVGPYTITWNFGPPKSEHPPAPTEPQPPPIPFQPALPTPPVRQIDPSLFEVPKTDGSWPDSTPLIVLGEGDAQNTWTMKNAFEGVLIFGATGSGKSSGSGAAIAESFLRTGFGGLVLTVKKDEAEHWRRLCAYCGREKDLITVSRGGHWRLNLLAYEAERPGQGGGLADNLVSFCQNLLGVSSRHHGPRFKEAIWEEASNELLNATFELFLIARAGITFDALANFVQNAPTERLPSNEDGWLKIPAFGTILALAKQRASTSEDKRMLQQATDYWFKVYAGYPTKLRSSITLGVFSMLDAFRARDIPAIISSDTNITPETIMAGKIVVLDLPLKEMGHTGLIVQSAWKYLFQTALERQGRARDPHRRPVFLWEDEGQYFFSDHDHHFQDTARSSRVSRVILSQNVHNFYKQFGDHVADSVFGNLNTKIFHANSDPRTNQYASTLFGTEVRMRASFSYKTPPPPKDMWDRFQRMINPPRTGGSNVSPHVEPAVRPEEFERLRIGGEENHFLVDAYITWLGLSTEEGQHFTMTTFLQNQQL